VVFFGETLGLLAVGVGVGEENIDSDTETIGEKVVSLMEVYGDKDEERIGV